MLQPLSLISKMKHRNWMGKENTDQGKSANFKYAVAFTDLIEIEQIHFVSIN